ncbi:MAG: triose-phosphate isomerase, partial [Pedococcus sp.]
MCMVADAGAQLVEPGRSERRQQFGETDEPVWAIGSAGRAASPHEAASVMAAMGDSTGALGDGSGCRALLYGGSVDRANAAA